jgi:hypothetical protein
MKNNELKRPTWLKKFVKVMPHIERRFKYWCTKCKSYHCNHTYEDSYFLATLDKIFNK